MRKNKPRWTRVNLREIVRKHLDNQPMSAFEKEVYHGWVERRFNKFPYLCGDELRWKATF